MTAPAPAPGRPPLTPQAIAGWVEFALYLADRILQLMGRRKSDRQQRETADKQEPPGP